MTNRSSSRSARGSVRSSVGAMLVLFALAWPGSAELARAAPPSGLLQLAGELDSLRKDTHSDKGSGQASPGTTESISLDSEESPGAWLFLEIAFYVVLSPFVIPYGALGDDWSRQGYFASAPYAGVPGYLQLGFDPDRDPRAMGRPLTGALVVEGGRPSADIERWGSWMRIETARLGLDLTGNLVREQLGNGEHDQLGLVSGDLTYRFAQGPRLQFRAGLGVNGLIDHGWSATGVDMLYGVDWMPRPPWVVALAVRGGGVGHAGVFAPRATVGLTTHGWQLEAGYSWLQVGSVDLGTPVLGVRRWF